MATSTALSDFSSQHLVAEKQSCHYSCSRFYGGNHRTTRVVLKHKFLFLSGDVRLSSFHRRKTGYLKHGGVRFPRAELQRENSDHGFVLDGVPHLSDWMPNLTTYPNPLRDNPAYSDVEQFFVHLDDVVPKDIVVRMNSPRGIHFRRAGPRERVCFKPDEVRACIVTCGGLCPGLNTVIREIVCGLQNMYGVTDVLGIVGGYKGFYSHNTIQLNPKVVNDIHKRGGTILGTSRGGHVTSKIVDSIQDRGINQVYILGGDGTQRGATVIYEEIQRRGMKVAVAGIPKTVDNDIAIIDKSFGFDTAVEEAQRAINAAHVEAESAENGVGLVKLMGRYSGFIAMYATLANRDVDCCLIPESPFYLEGEGGLYEFVKKRINENGHAVIVVAEGAGQDLVAESMQNMDKADASGNQLLLDVGLWLSQKLKDHFRTEHKVLNLKYIDPTYMVRAIPSNASDNVYCSLLAQNAIHGAMAGYTGFTVGSVNGKHVYIPNAHVTETRKQVNTTDRMWARLLSSTNQPSFLRYEEVMKSKREKESTKMLEELSALIEKTNSSTVQENGFDMKTAETACKQNGVARNKLYATVKDKEKKKEEGAN